MEQRGTERKIRVGHFFLGVDELCGPLGNRSLAGRRMGLARLFQQPESQGLEAPFLGHGRTGSPLGPVGQIDVLQGRQGRRVIYITSELRSQQLPFFQ